MELDVCSVKLCVTILTLWTLIDNPPLSKYIADERLSFYADEAVSSHNIFFPVVDDLYGDL